MWRIEESERRVFHKILDTYSELTSDFDKEEFLNRRILHENGDEGLTIANILKENEVGSEEVEAIYKLLPAEAEFYKFVEVLRPKMQATGSATQEDFQQRREEYRARIQRLKEQQENREYAEMTKSIDLRNNTSLMRNFGQEMRSANRQIIAVTNALITVGGAFVFGFYGIQLAYPHLELELLTRMILGLIFATIVLFADFYFIIKNME